MQEVTVDPGPVSRAEKKDGTSTFSDKTTNNRIQLTNILFNQEFLDSFLALNDAKISFDHDTGQLPKNHWGDVSEALHVSDNNDVVALQLVIAEEGEHCDKIKSIHVQEFDIMAFSVMKEKVNQLLKVRKEVQRGMSNCTEHDSK